MEYKELVFEKNCSNIEEQFDIRDYLEDKEPKIANIKVILENAEFLTNENFDFLLNYGYMEFIIKELQNSDTSNITILISFIGVLFEKYEKSENLFNEELFDILYKLPPFSSVLHLQRWPWRYFSIR